MEGAGNVLRGTNREGARLQIPEAKVTPKLSMKLNQDPPLEFQPILQYTNLNFQPLNLL